MTIFTILACLVVLFICGWKATTDNGILACVGIAWAGSVLIDLGSRPQGKPTKEPKL